MKLFIDYELENPNKASTGKGKFLSRLIPELEKLGVECKIHPKGCDVHLGISWFNTKTDLPKVLRVDGLSFDKSPEAFGHSLKKAKRSIKMTDAIIWQSAFCRKMLSDFIGATGKKETIIFNGSSGLSVPKIDYNAVIMSAHWYKKGHERTNKRLKEMLEIATFYVSKNDRAIFYIAGETNYKSQHNRIKVLGHIPQNELNYCLSISNCMLYLTFYDWAPNSVVEALCMGIPVICSNNSGVAELVGNNGGTILNLDRELELKDLYLYKKHPPAIDHDEVFKALDYYLEDRKFVYKPELHIENIAKQYKEYIKCVIS